MKQTAKERLLQIIEQEIITEAEAQFCVDVIETSPHTTKRDLMELAGLDSKSGLIDTSYPIPYYREIEMIYPDIRNGVHVYDYSLGINKPRLININNIIINRILNLKR